MNIHDYRSYSNMNNGEIKQNETFYKSLQLTCTECILIPAY